MECDELKTTEKKSFKFELMSSEWFTEIPDDLEDNWIVKFCPQGCRVLFTARGNQTHISINGRIILNIKTNFPGGGGGGKDRHGEHMFRKPKDYVCMEVYLENLAKRKKLKRSKSNTVTEMEVQ
ncbi:hypothetical protein NQ315_013242 [Exocentrus adspersus]|uniref:Snurportin-1 n=1 Tax=Exocentrus adspersus TaxID=1586481 RepID=A0AAV8V789_9CUCU|nr:hypothetical protein NQ315_013242 [Exocentrus adspersus]